MLGSSNEKYSWQALTISMLFVLNSFMKNQLITKSSDASWDLLSGQASKPYSNIGMYTLFTIHVPRHPLPTSNIKHVLWL